MFVTNYLRNRGVFVLIILMLSLLTAWLISPRSTPEIHHVQGTVIEVTSGDLPTLLVQLENGQQTRILATGTPPTLNSQIQLIEKRYANGEIRYHYNKTNNAL